MIQSNLLVIAIIIFLLLLVGLIFIVIEFNAGEPKKQAEGQYSLTPPPPKR